MSKISCGAVFGASIIGAVALTTFYAFAQETLVAITEVIGCMLAATICANLE
jgi:hypothetical protein